MSAVITDNLPIWTAAPNGIKKLRELILQLAVRGLLLPQDPNDEPASELLQKIAAEKDALLEAGKIKKPKPLPEIGEDEKPFALPQGWEWVRLGDILQRISNGFNGKQGKDGIGKPLSRIETISMSQVDMTKVGYCQDISDEKLDYYRLNSGDILLSHINSDFHLGKTALVPDNIELYHGVNLLLLRVLEGAHPRFIDLVINEKRLSGYFLAIAQHAIGQASINQGKITSIVVSFPPPAEQSRIVAKVDELMVLCDRLEQEQDQQQSLHQELVSTVLDSLTQAASPNAFHSAWTRIAAHFDTLFSSVNSINQLKQTLLQLAVMGKLVPQNPNDEPASLLLQKIDAEKNALVKAGKIKTQNPLPEIREDEKPFELPVGWEWCRGETVADFIDPHPSHRTPPEMPGGVPYIGYADIDHLNGINFSGARKVSQQVLQEHQERYRLKNGDFVFGKIGTLGEPFFLQEPFNYCLSANLILIQPNLDSIVPKFLALYMDCPFFLSMINDSKTNSTHGVFGIKKARLITLPLPPLAEQSRIVAKVDDLMALCDRLSARLQEAQLTQIRLAEAIVEQAVT